MITLHTFPGMHGLESVSPFCMKAEVYFKLMQLPYVARSSDPRRAPKGKLPYIEQDGGPAIADSDAILQHFEQRQKGALDVGMTADQVARARLVQRTMEEGLYFVLLWSRWVDETGWAVFKNLFDGVIPAPVRWAVVPLVRKRVAASLVAQGTGRHSRDEIYAIGGRDIAALATTLGDRPFFLGDELRTIDVIGYAFLGNILKFKADNPLRSHLENTPNLERYVERVGARVASASEGREPVAAG